MNSQKNLELKFSKDAFLSILTEFQTFPINTYFLNWEKQIAFEKEKLVESLKFQKSVILVSDLKNLHL